ncbi:MAG: acetylornithine/succinyldiaminopimelate transaminase [Moraxellaceae bacterium]|nr:acetylornithine/succinyldiaminopimelate transaminase [Moraxellaceae bacterium]
MSHPVQRADFDRYMVPVFSPLEMIFVRGEGSRLWDQAGRDYIDFGAGIAVTALGHGHPALLAALHEQAAKLWHVSNYYTNEPVLKLARMICESTFAERVFFSNSGAEANEGAIKLARKRAIDRHGPEKIEIVAFNGSFHGRTFMTMAVGGQPKYSSGMGPLPEGIIHVDYNDIEAVRRVIGPKTCAVVIEPVVGESGVVPATPEFLRTLRELCTQHDAMLVFDEIQSGNGRTGNLFAYMGYGVTPDILTTAKGIAGGFPMGVMMTTEAIASAFHVGSHGSTFGGNPLAAAVACAALDLIRSDAVLSGVRSKAEHAAARLRALAASTGCFSEVRYAGLWFGLQLVPALAGRAKDFVTIGAEEGLLVLQGGPDVVRLATSLVISDAELDEGLDRLERVCKRVKA